MAFYFPHDRPVAPRYEPSLGAHVPPCAMPSSRGYEPSLGTHVPPHTMRSPQVYYRPHPSSTAGAAAHEFYPDIPTTASWLDSPSTTYGTYTLPTTQYLHSSYLSSGFPGVSSSKQKGLSCGVQSFTHVPVDPSPRPGKSGPSGCGGDSGTGGVTQAYDVGFEKESEWLEFFPEHGGLGVRAKKRLPKGRFLCKLREYTAAEGVPSRDFFVKVNDAAYYEGVSLAEYNCRKDTCNCWGQGTADGSFLVTLKDIAPGEALSLHYGQQFWFEGKPFSKDPNGRR
uniref:SET domain-containing protein n=1 Tax=Eutreptiella gymnastica TaxID=73025 RepID=A0A7S4G4U7_9EUGL